MRFDDVKMIGQVVLLSGLLTAGIAGTAISQGGGESIPSGHMVKGDVLDMDGEFYVIKDITGHEMRLHVNKDTQMEDRIKVGDKIEAQVTSDGHAKSIRVQIPDGGPSPQRAPTMMP